MKNKLKLVLLILIIGASMSCQRDIYKFNHEFSIPKKSKELPLVQGIIDESDYTHFSENQNISKALDYTKIPYKTIQLKDFNETKKIAPTTRVICLYGTDGFNDDAIASLLNFVAKGGTLYITKALRDERLSFLMGFNPNATKETDKSAKGYYFNYPIFPGKKEFSFDNNEIHNGYNKRNFSSNITVLASAVNNTDYPVLLENKIGKGRVLLYNSVNYISKIMRGFAFASALKGLEGIPYPTANVATIFLDDFPSPTYKIYKEPIKSELNITISEYVKDVWWPDMKKYAIKENIKYTAYTTFDYNANVNPPFTFNEWDRNTFTKDNILQAESSWIGKDVLNSGHELGFHGYNHVSLTKEEWTNPDYIVTALNAAEKKWKILNYKNLPTSYVPPSNYIDSIGISKLKKGMPSIKYMQSLYLGHLEDGGNREFDPDPYNNKLFDYPRISSGYFLKNSNEWNIESMYICTGIWTHFIHPDDVYQIPSKSNAKTSGHFGYRNPNSLNWYSKNGKKGLLDTFKDHITDYKKRHPYSRFIDATSASEITLNWRYSYYEHSNYDGIYEVESKNARNKDGDNYWLMYVDKKNIGMVDNALAQEALSTKKTPFLNGYLYSIKTTKPAISVPDLYNKSENKNTSGDVVIRETQDSYKSFLKVQELMTPINEQIKRHVADGNLKEATDIIEKNLYNSYVNVTLWEEYAEYMVWQSREKDLWRNLNKYYNRFNTKGIASLSRKINAIASYPNLKETKKWLTRQLDWDTNDDEVLKEYIATFNTLENKDLIKKALKKLIAINPSTKNTTAYINYLLENKDDNLVSELEAITPCDEKYKELATTIAWVFADNLRYDQALLWYDCSTINDLKIKEHWLLNSANFERVKETDFPYYISLLLANDAKKATRELKEIVACSNELQHLAKKIATTYADYGNFIKAVAWAECAQVIKIKDKLSWYFEVKDINRLKKAYKQYIVESPEDNDTKIYMATLLLYHGDVNEAVKTAYSVPKHKIDASFLTTLNKEIKNLSFKEQVKIYNLYADLLDPEMGKSIAKKIRQEQGNSISFSTSNVNDRFKPTTLENILSYNFHNTIGDMHSFSGTQSIMYAIKSGPDNIDNIGRDLMGLQYMFTKKSKEKYQYSFRARIERDNLNKLYYQGGASISYSKKKNFTSYQVDAFPVKSGPGHSLGLYRVQLTGYKELALSKSLVQTFSLESNYYSDDEMDATFLGQLKYTLLNGKKIKLSPLIEGVYGKGSADRRNGYPYWMDDDRIYGGAGVELTLGSEKSKFNLRADYSKFAENEEPNFERYTGEILYKITDFTAINAAYEVYTIDNFFSNVFQLGLIYKFK